MGCLYVQKNDGKIENAILDGHAGEVMNLNTRPVRVVFAEGEDAILNRDCSCQIGRCTQVHTKAIQIQEYTPPHGENWIGN